jgi:hypothetical protein
MIRNLKVLGLTLAAVFALSAVAATAASAQNGTITSTGAVTLTATENAGQRNAFTAFGFEVECPGSTYTFHKLNSLTAHIPNDSSQATITPHYKQPCVANPGNFPTTIDMNGCDYALTLGTTTATADQYKATFHVVCPANVQITVTIFTNATKHAENKPFCKLHVVLQQNLVNEATVKDNTNGNIQLNGTVKGIAVQKTKGVEDPLLCPANQGTGEYHISVTATGQNEAGGATSVSLSHL